MNTNVVQIILLLMVLVVAALGIVPLFVTVDEQAPITNYSTLICLSEVCINDADYTNCAPQAPTLAQVFIAKDTRRNNAHKIIVEVSKSKCN